MSLDMFPDSAIDYLLEQDMAKHKPDHGDNYKRMTGPEGQEIGSLGPECGHHCGVLTSGGTNKHIGHCPKNCCHGTPMNELPVNLTTQQGGVDPRGIH